MAVLDFVRLTAKGSDDVRRETVALYLPRLGKPVALNFVGTLCMIGVFPFTVTPSSVRRHFSEGDALVVVGLFLIGAAIIVSCIVSGQLS